VCVYRSGLVSVRKIIIRSWWRELWNLCATAYSCRIFACRTVEREEDEKRKFFFFPFVLHAGCVWARSKWRGAYRRIISSFLTIRYQLSISAQIPISEDHNWGIWISSHWKSFFFSQYYSYHIDNYSLTCIGVYHNVSCIEIAILCTIFSFTS